MTPHQIYMLRIRKNKTQKEMAAIVGVTMRTVQNWEHGVGKGPRPGDIMLMKSLEK